MKILCICYEDMGGAIGGVRQVVEIAEHLLKRGHKVEISAPRIRKYSGITSLKIRYVPTINIKILRPLVYHLLSFFYIFGAFIKFKPDIVLTYEIFLSFIPSLIAGLNKTPQFVVVNGDTEDFQVKGYPRPLLLLIDVIRRINFWMSNGVVTVTEELKQILSKQYKIEEEKILIVHNGADTEVFKPMEKRQARKMVGLDAEQFYIGFLGGLYPWHGVDYLIKSIPEVSQKYPSARFVIAGHGPEKRRLADLAEKLQVANRTIFLGAIPFEKVPLYINSFDVCVVFFKPVRRNSGNPIKLFEYLSCARPIIASREGGYGAFVEGIGAGIRVQASKSQEVARAISRLIENRNERERMGKQARDAVVTQYSWNKTAEALENFFCKQAVK